MKPAILAERHAADCASGDRTQGTGHDPFQRMSQRRLGAPEDIRLALFERSEFASRPQAHLTGA